MDVSCEDQVATKRPRRCVQSKLSFSVSPQASGPKVATALPNAEVEDGGSDSGRKKIKSKRKKIKNINPQVGDPVESADNDKGANESSGHKKKSDRILKSKQSGGETPKNKTPIRFGHAESNLKRRMLNCNYDDDDETQSLCDLWSEAKKAAEENHRLSAGKETHPFFSLCKATKRSSETKHTEKSENPSWFSISLPPVHVFATVKDDLVVPNWKNWKFLETSLQKIDGYCSIEISSAFEVPTKSLIFRASCGKETKLDRLLADEKMDGTFKATNSSIFSSQPLSKEQLSSQLEMVHVACNFSCSSTHGITAYDDQDKMHNERLSSYYQRSICCSDCNLWTEKYRPEISLEVCGNVESVKLLGNWLKSWFEKSAQNSANESSRDHCTMAESEDSSYFDESDMDELDVGDYLKNVLLITGPAGSGKSAAIYACAKEQGFKVIEVNASSLRNSAYMRQTFGESVDSLGLTHWLAEDQIHQHSKDVLELQMGMPVVAENELESHSVTLASKFYNTQNAIEKTLPFHFANKTLFLFEEVDVVFDEDQGFVSMILKLAETTKRPIILTSNTKKPALPHLLDRLVLDFQTPSNSELLYHASMVCAFEKVHISCSLLQHIINSCVGDIRRILMLLQFWCQGFRDITEKTIQCTKVSVPFEIDAVHLAIPKVIPWDFCCELSKKVEEEISNAVFAMEQSFIVKNFLQHNVDTLQKVNTINAVKGRKKRKLRKHSIVAHAESSDHMNHLQDFFYDSDSISTCSQKTSKRKCSVVLSSQSDDGYSSDELKPKHVSTNQALQSSDKLKTEDRLAQSNGYNLRVFATSPTSQSQEIYGPSQPYKMDESKDAFAVPNFFDISETASTSLVCDTTRLQDVSCMSESTSISVTETNPIFTFIPQEASHNSELAILFDSNISPHTQPGVDMNIADGNTELRKCCHIRTTDAHTEFFQENLDFGCFKNEEEHGSIQCQPVDSIVCSQEFASIPKMWKRLRSCDENLKLLSTNSKDVSLVASLTSRLADLISETDVMLSTCNPIICDNLEPASTPCIEPDSFSWYDDQVEMGSTIAHHGFCFYTMKVASVGSCLGFNNTLDLAQEMLNSSTSSTALGKLIIQESTTGQNSCFKDSDVKKTHSSMLFGRESVPDLYNAILPIVPARLSMALKDIAFHEYLSFVGQISRFECSRLADCSVEKQKRRPRVRMHYLSSGEHQLSSEQAELLAQRCYFKKNSSKIKHNTST